MKNWEQAATVADESMFIVSMLPAAMATPPNVLKKVMALVIPASINAFSQSNFCSTVWVSLFTQQIVEPLMVKVGFLEWIVFIQPFRILPLMVNVGFVTAHQK